MEIRWLEDFIVLARTRHFSRTATEQNVTQPTLSRRIKLLEEEMGTTLIDRNTLPLSLTPAGEAFLSAAEKITHTAREAKRHCKEIEEAQSNSLSFATTQTLYLNFYKSWLKPFSDSLGVDIELNLESTTWLINDFVSALRQQQCDLMLCYWHEDIALLKELDSQEFEFIHINNEHIVPVSAVNPQGKLIHALPGVKRKPLPYISYHDNSFLGPLMKRFLSQCDEQAYLTTVNENMHSVSVQAMIREGFGVGWVPERLVNDDLSNHYLALAGDSRWNLPLQVRLYRLRNNANPNLSTFWHNIKNTNITIDS